jgi:hypothetical protein
VAEAVYARPFALAVGTLRMRLLRNGYPQLDKIAVADGLRMVNKNAQSRLCIIDASSTIR